MISALGNKQDLEMEGIKSLYQCLEKGYNSMPLDLPGTPFRKAMKVIVPHCLDNKLNTLLDFWGGFLSFQFCKARKLLNETLRRLIEKRRESGRHGGGLLGVLLEAKEEKLTHQLSDSQIADNLIGVIFAAHDTTASVLTWILKYLHDNANLLDAVTVIILISLISF